MESTAHALMILAPGHDPHSLAAMCVDAENEQESKICLPLTDGEKRMLEDNEQMIEQGLNSWYEIGRALSVIRRGKLYRANYSSFEEYCRERWRFGRHRGIQMIQASEAFVDDVDNCQHRIPERESHARILLELPDANARQKVLAEVEDEAGTKAITASRIKKAVDRYLGRPNESKILDVQIINEPAPTEKRSEVIVQTNLVDKETNVQAIERLFKAIREYAEHHEYSPTFETLLFELQQRVGRLLKDVGVPAAA